MISRRNVRECVASLLVGGCNGFALVTYTVVIGIGIDVPAGKDVLRRIDGRVLVAVKPQPAGNIAVAGGQRNIIEPVIAQLAARAEMANAKLHGGRAGWQRKDDRPLGHRLHVRLVRRMPRNLCPCAVAGAKFDHQVFAGCRPGACPRALE